MRACSVSRTSFARQNDVAALAVEFDDAAFDFFAPQRVEILDRPNIDLRSGQERAYADIHGKAAFDAFDDASANDDVFVEGLLDVFPDFDFLGLFLGKNDVAVAVFGVFEQNIDDIADLDGEVTAGIDKLRDGNDTFGLVADIDDDVGVGDFQNGALHDFAFCEFAGTILI